MKPITTITILLAMFSLPLFALQCEWCHHPMLEDYLCCRNCGKEKGTHPPRPYDFHDTEDDVSSAVIDKLAGTGRGLVTISLSPFNVVRGMGTGFHWLFSLGSSTQDSSSESTDGSSIDGGDLGPLGAVLAGGAISFCVAAGATLGTVTTCADVTNGTFDMISVGYYGDWLYDSEVSGKPTPWIWKRKWYSSQFPWINKE